MTPSDTTGGIGEPAAGGQSSGASTGERTPTLSLRNASKAFAGVHALEDVSLDLYAGEAHALVGENGAGKSTLVKILGGVHQPDVGTLLIDGREVVLGGTADARQAGIAVIYQEPTLFPDLSVAENVFIGRQPLRSGRRIDYRAMDAEVNRIFERLGVQMDPGPDRPRAVDRRAAARRDRQGPFERREGPDHGRAHRSALSGRGRTAVQESPKPCARMVPRCCSSRTVLRKCSCSASGSPSCVTAGS